MEKKVQLFYTLIIIQKFIESYLIFLLPYSFLIAKEANDPKRRGEK